MALELIIRIDAEVYNNFLQKIEMAKKNIRPYQPWYHKWNDGNNPVMWFIRTTLLKLDYMGLIDLRIGQLYRFRDILS